MKKYLVIWAGMFCLLTVLTADIKLPKPATNSGPGLFDLINHRASGARNAFPTGAVSQAELSTILWAATGRNRNGKGWTVPTAGGRPPYVRVYAVKNDGAFLYDWDSHSLIEIATQNIKAEVTLDDFVRKSAVILVFVAEPESQEPAAGSGQDKALASVLAGAMSQNVYLTADALGISTRYLITLPAEGIKRGLKLKNEAAPLCIMPLAKR